MRRILRSQQNTANKKERLHKVKIHSKLLGHEIKANVLLPTDYNINRRHYPVLYLLHGYGGNRNSWINNTDIEEYSRQYQFIIVFPESGRLWFINNHNGNCFEDHLVDELVPYVDEHYTTITSRDGRAIGGFSMGGAAAFIQTFRYPGLFSATVSHSGAFGAHSRCGDPYESLRSNSSMHMPSIKMHEQAWGPPGSSTRNEYDIYRIIKEYKMKQPLSLYIDVGLDDYKRVLQMNRDFHEALSGLGIQHTYREHVDKKHDWIYLNQHIKDSLSFIDKHIARPVSSPAG